MKNKHTMSNLIISAGLSIIFGYASHTWYGGLIVGACYFIIAMLITKKNK